ncbi:MAG TPA: Gfo/Idh/MocA family oxidoreductase [Candidatus Eisenbergiella merdigallinarum]|uniref:Gfo/Idh/MocA family oxidoreductase n=1 Tax=Candidatus Eisenbergiella merdigallinarum TaxID=2838552 RepID=A0A9D2SDR7_9FIRM|nr:Gfo/Idh/MocA family oxidoreductase [Candidatus Eisenbergiella merdigallinarum]
MGTNDFDAGSDVPRIILAGAGDRGMIYAKQSLERPRRFRIVGVVEPMEERRNFAGDLFEIPGEFRFSSAEEAAAVPKFGDAIFNCTMDRLHAATSIPFMEKGYHILLEKPIATNGRDAERILQCAQQNRRIVMVCHVLRYAPFYRTVKELVLSGEIGNIIDIQMAERVSYFHESVSYVRGKYGDPDICGSGMLLSKCSHDLDIMAWLMNGVKPKRVSSVGSLFQFRPENAPAGAAERCLPDCPHLERCAYSCKRLYVDHPQRWANRVWNDCGLSGGTDAEKLASLSDENNRYGRCVYHTGMKVVDHQSVLVLFENGTTGTMSMTAGASAAERSIRIIGTLGEIYGEFSRERITVSLIAPQAKGGNIERAIDVSPLQKGDAHGNGDRLIIEDFLRLLKGETPSICCTSIEDSMTGHEIACAAEKDCETTIL